MFTAVVTCNGNFFSNTAHLFFLISDEKHFKKLIPPKVTRDDEHCTGTSGDAQLCEEGGMANSMLIVGDLTNY